MKSYEELLNMYKNEKKFEKVYNYRLNLRENEKFRNEKIKAGNLQKMLIYTLLEEYTKTNITKNNRINIINGLDRMYKLNDFTELLEKYRKQRLTPLLVEHHRKSILEKHENANEISEDENGWHNFNIYNQGCRGCNLGSLSKSMHCSGCLQER